MTEIVIRRGGADDWPTVAAIHLASWRSAYRGIYPDDYLDGPAAEERRHHWREAAAALGADDALFLAEVRGRPAGFACIRAGPEREVPLLNNLHVLPDRKGQGIGGALIRAAASWLAERRPDAALELMVWERNTAARGFYRALGGIERGPFEGSTPAGTKAPEMLVRWERATALAEG